MRSIGLQLPDGVHPPLGLRLPGGRPNTPSRSLARLAGDYSADEVSKEPAARAVSEPAQENWRCSELSFPMALSASHV